MAALVALLIVLGVLAVIGGVTWWFGDRQVDGHQHHLPPYRNDRRR